MSTPTPLQLQLWTEALRSGFLAAQSLRDWSEQMILSPDPQPRWVIHLYDSKSDEEARRPSASD